MSAELWMWLAAGMGYGAVNISDLLNAYPGGAGDVMNDLGGPKLDEILTQKQAERLAASRPEDFALKINHAETMGIHALPFDSPYYPDMLRSIINPPPIIFVKGDLSLLNGQLSVGIVGARRPTAYGVEAVKTIGRGIAMGGAIIISGLAAGLDAEAHKAALAVNGPTIACVAFGLDTCYPAANRKLMEVIERYGAVVSEYPMGTTPEKPYFLQRNRIIAGLSHALLVVEARKASGTMSTVNFAADYGRDVFAVPGSIFSELSGGTNAMIREGAYLAATAADVLDMYGVSAEDGDEAVARQAVQGRPAAAEYPSHPAAHFPEPPASAIPFDPYAHPAAGEARPGKRPVEPPRQPAAQSPAPAAGRGSAGMEERFLSDMKRAGAPAAEPREQTPPKVVRRIRPAETTADAAQSRALDERAAEVVDSVSFSSAPPKVQTVAGATRAPEKQPEETAGGSRVSLFNWGSVKHLSRDEISADGTHRDEAPAREPLLGKPLAAAKKKVKELKTPAAPDGPAQEGLLSFLREQPQARPEPILFELPEDEMEPAAPPAAPQEANPAAAFVPLAAVTPQAPSVPANPTADAPEEPAATQAPDKQTMTDAILSRGPIEPVGRVTGVEPVVPLQPARAASSISIQDAAQSLAASVLGKSAKGAAKGRAKPKAVEDDRAVLPSELNAANLAGRLRTMKKMNIQQEEPVKFGQRPKTDTVSLNRAGAFSPAAQGSGAAQSPAAAKTAPAPVFSAPAALAANPPAKTFAPRPAAAAPETAAAPATQAAIAPPATQTQPATIGQEATAVPQVLSAGIAFEEVKPGDESLLVGLSESAKKAYRQLGPKPMSLRSICENSGLSPGEAMAALTELELAGLSRQQAGRQFIAIS